MGKARDLANLLTNGLVAPTKLSAGAPTWNAASSVGIKATPNASWASDYSVLQMNSTGSINGNAVAIVMANNIYYDGTNFRYLTTGPASDYFQYNGSHTWRYAASGTAGAVATMVLGMTQDPAGNWGLGVTPSAWDSTFKNIQIGGSGFSGSFYSQANGDISNGIVLNAYFSSGWKYTASSKAATQYEQNNGVHTWSRAPSGTAGNAISFVQAMTLDASGNLGIGSTSPSGRLTLQRASSGANTDINWKNEVGNDRARIRFGGSNEELSFWTPDSTTLAERARIDSSGNFMVGTTSASGAKLTVSAGNNLGLRVDTSTANESVIITGTSSNLQVKHPAAGVELLNSGGNAFRIVALSNGVSLAASGTSWGAISDERLKDIIEPITNASAKVASLRAIIGKYKTDEEGVRRSFLIAQDVKAVFPEAVVKASEDDDTLLLQYTDTIPLLVAAIQEQQAFIQSLQADVAALKAAA